MLKRLVGVIVLGIAGFGLVVVIAPAWADHIIHLQDDRDCACAPPGDRDDRDGRDDGDDRDAHRGCPKPITQNCWVTHDPRWPEAVLKCRSIFPLPR